jgi:integrase/recombinase XerD
VLKSAILQFLESKRLDRGASDHTISSYQTDLKQFSDFLGKPPAPPIDLSQVTEKEIDNYITYLSKLKQQATSVSRKMSTLRQFFKFCCLELDLPKNPMEQIRSPKLPKRLPKALSLQDTDKLLKTVMDGLPYSSDKKEALQARDRTLVYLLYATGLRVSELVGLELKQIDLDLDFVRIHGKGEKERVVPFAKIARVHLEDYLKNHYQNLKPASNHLFVNERGFALTRQGFWKTLKALAFQSEIKDPISPHVLRHSFATHLLQSGMNLRSLQMLLGHSDLSTTQIYTQMDWAHLRNIHKKYHPRGE